MPLEPNPPWSAAVELSDVRWPDFAESLRNRQSLPATELGGSGRAKGLLEHQASRIAIAPMALAEKFRRGPDVKCFAGSPQSTYIGSWIEEVRLPAERENPCTQLGGNNLGSTFGIDLCEQVSRLDACWGLDALPQNRRRVSAGVLVPPHTSLV